MLQYRRIDSVANVESVNEEDVPEGLLAEMNQEVEEARAAKAEKQKDQERRRHTARLYLYCGEKLVQLEVDKRTTFRAFKQQVAEQFDLVEAFEQGDARLCMLNAMHDMPATPVEAEDDALLADCKLDIANGSGDVLVQLRPELPAGAPAATLENNWDLHYGPELRSSEIRYRSSPQLRLTLCSLVVGDANATDAVGEDASALGQLAVAATVNSSVVVRLREGSTVGDLRAAIADVFAVPAEKARIVHSGFSGNRLILETDALLLTAVKVFNGDSIFVRDTSVDLPRPIPLDEESRLIDSINTIHIHYTDVNGSEFLQYLQVPKTIASKTLFAKIGSVLQVEPRQLRVLDQGYETKRTPHRRRNRLTIKTSDETATVPVRVFLSFYAVFALKMIDLQGASMEWHRRGQRLPVQHDRS